MNFAETVALIEALKAAGVTKFKSLEHEIAFGGTAQPSLQPDVPRGTMEVPPITENKEATEKLKDLISTLRMSPEELANQIFPDGAM